VEDAVAPFAMPEWSADRFRNRVVGWRKTDRTTSTHKERIMTVAKITEISSSSKKGFEDAIKTGIERASKTLKNIQGAWISEQKVTVKKGKIEEYRVMMRVSFVLED